MSDERTLGRICERTGRSNKPPTAFDVQHLVMSYHNCNEPSDGPEFLNEDGRSIIFCAELRVGLMPYLDFGAVPQIEGPAAAQAKRRASQNLASNFDFYMERRRGWIKCWEGIIFEINLHRFTVVELCIYW